MKNHVVSTRPRRQNPKIHLIPLKNLGNGLYSQKPSDDIPRLLKKAQETLGLDPRSVGDEIPGAQTLRRTLSNLGQVVLGVAEIRTLYGTGHGRSKSRELEIAHARLVVNAAVSIATFFAEVWQDRTAT